MKESIELLKQKLTKLHALLDIETKQNRQIKLQEQSTLDGFWDDQQSAQKNMQELSEISDLVSLFDELVQRIDDLLALGEMDESESIADDMQQELISIEEQILRLEDEALFSGKFDDADALVSIHAGTGGVDAQDWARMLQRMYLRFCEQQGWNTKELSTSYADEAGIKSTEFEVSGRRAYGHLKAEHGVHRLVRLSPFNAKNSRETSFALVEVIPLLTDEAEVDIREEDIRTDVFRARGHGGQSVNTTDSAVRITHVPTGIVVSCQNERSQLQNKRIAMRILGARLAVLQEQQRSDELKQIKGDHKQGSWGNQLRSYVFQPYTMVKDHRTDHETSNVDSVLDGDLLGFVLAWLRHNKRSQHS